MALDYEKIQKWSKILTILSSLILIALGIARFCNIMNVMNPIDYIVNIYMIFLGVLFILCEIKWETVLQHFNFLRYFLGKAIFSLFLGLICFNRHHWFTIAVGIILWVVCVFCVIMGVFFWEQEKGMFTGQASSSQIVNVVKVQQSAQKV